MFLFFYSWLFRALTPALKIYLRRRKRTGKEHAERFSERFGIDSIMRPDGKLLWVNAVSVGEAQAALILIEKLKVQFPKINILVTTVTTTSAALMEKRLPSLGGLHQFSPVDHPDWVSRFFENWHPDACLWMESELWPNTLSQIHKRKIPCALMNAHMSPKSYSKWRFVKPVAKTLLKSFAIGYAQSEQDCNFYKALGLENIRVTENLKYASNPLPYNHMELDSFKEVIAKRPVWVYASTHANEEDLAARIHGRLAKSYPDLLTIIVPRHPSRRDEIAVTLENTKQIYRFRGEHKELPQPDDQIYIADTVGDLGLFYKLADIAVIGRSFSCDGGGGHNPIEAAQLGCAVLYGPNVQNLQDIFDAFKAAGAAQQVQSEDELYSALDLLLGQAVQLEAAKSKAGNFIKAKQHIIDSMMNDLIPLFSGLKS